MNVQQIFSAFSLHFLCIFSLDLNVRNDKLFVACDRKERKVIFRQPSVNKFFYARSLNSSITCATIDKKPRNQRSFALSWTNGLLEPAGLFWQIPHS